jgi:two-component system KDP operon response regulator KdpE
VRAVTTGRAALDAAAEHRPDVVLLDLGLPDIDGVDVCRYLRRWLPSPVIVLTADGAEDRKILALDEGADDYVTKPFSMPELLARVRVAVRHRRALSALVDTDLLDLGDLRIDVAAHEAWLGGEAVHLPRKEFALLALLTRNAGRVLTHATLLREVWPERQGDDDTQVLRTHLTVLRKKLGRGDQRPRIVSEPGVGYRLVLVD